MPKRRQVPRLFAQKHASGNVTYYWKPEKRLRLLGFKNVALGADQIHATREAIALNEDVAGRAPRPSQQRKRVYTVSDCITAYKSHSKFQSKAQKTRSQYALRCSEIANWAVDGTLPLRSITRKMVSDFVEDSLHTTSPAVAAHRLRTLRLLLNFAIEQEMIDRNATTGIPIPKVERRKVHRDWPAIRDAATRADELGCPYTGPALRIGFWTMQRQGDLLSFTRFAWQEIHDCDPRDRQALVGPTGRVMGLFLSDGQSKTGTPVVCPIPPFLHDEIERRLNASQFLFPHATNPMRAVSGNYFGKAVNRTMRKVGLTGVVHKDMRRCGMTWARALGAAPADIRSVSGHQTPQAERMDEVYMPRNIRGACRAIAATVRAMAEIAELEREDQS